MAKALSEFASPSKVEQEYCSSEWSDKLSFSALELDYQARADLELLSAVINVRRKNGVLESENVTLRLISNLFLPLFSRTQDNKKDIFSPAMYSFASPESERVWERSSMSFRDPKPISTKLT